MKSFLLAYEKTGQSPEFIICKDSKEEAARALGCTIVRQVEEDGSENCYELSIPADQFEPLTPQRALTLGDSQLAQDLTYPEQWTDGAFVYQKGDFMILFLVVNSEKATKYALTI